MKVRVNESRLQIGQSMYRSFLFTTPVMIALSFGLRLTEDYAIFSTPFAYASAFSVIVALYFKNRWMNEPKTHEVMRKGIGKGGSTTLIFHYYRPADSILITTKGVYTLTDVKQPIEGVVKGVKWKRKGGLLKRIGEIISGNMLRDPFGRALKEAGRTQRFLRRAMKDKQLIVHPVIVLINPDAQVTIEEPFISVVYLMKKTPSLKDFLLNHEGQPLTEEQINRIALKFT